MYSEASGCIRKRKNNNSPDLPPLPVITPFLYFPLQQNSLKDLSILINLKFFPSIISLNPLQSGFHLAHSNDLSSDLIAWDQTIASDKVDHLLLLEIAFSSPWFLRNHTHLVLHQPLWPFLSVFC